MPFFLIIALLIAMFLLITFYFYHYNKKKAQEQNEKKSLSSRVEKLKKRFKASLKPLTQSGCLSQKESDALYRIANYYFVYQTMTPENVAHYEQLTSDLLNVIEVDVLASLSRDEDAAEFTQNVLMNLVQSLPPRVDGYTAGFYRNDLPVLTQRLKDSFANSADESASHEQMLTE
ncbi:hypothetical protein NM09_02150 [Vibrio caribbeanicus]|uniref:Uncharacterized protein n=1 Tax=Vibrio caribbeanicus TaxID=701175 RepID=A0ACC4P261_9VIBR|nr:hypothetical protein [Vibrio caribbeanicus]KHD26840.1 hypothetical protein NM09_02150 [Vibrio caribbeanicus]